MKRETHFNKIIKGYLKNTRFGKKYRTKVRLKKGYLFDINKSIDDLFPEVPNISLKLHNIIIPKIGIHKDQTEFYGYKNLSSYYLRYKRFLDFNLLKHEIVDISKSDWKEQCKDLDVLIVAYNSEPSRLNELQMKIYILERFYNVLCYPSYSDLLSYEDKTKVYMLVKEHGFNHAETFVSHNLEESTTFTSNCEYPLVSKIKTGSGSRGVELVYNKRQAMSIVKKNFGLGRKALWTYSYEKDYVYFQEFIKDATYDLRVFMVGDVIAGYRRRMKGDDFRASGAGLLDRRLFPKDALEIALKLKKKWNSTILAVDFVDTNNSKEHKIIEVSTSFGLDYPEYLEIDGKRVFYQKTDNGIEVKDGCFWVQDFIIIEMIRKWNDLQNETDCPIHIDWELQEQNKQMD